MQTKTIIRFTVREMMGLAVMAVALFWAAGSVNWWPAWAALGVMAAWSASTAAVILRFNPELLAERLGPGKGAKRWDTIIMSLLGLLQLGRYIVAGLDQRHGWTGGFPLSAQIIALLLCLLGYALVVWATAVNAFFSQIVRLQPERNQRVVMDGPYRFIRHPAYLGAIIYELAIAVLLSSWWVLVCGLVTTGLLILRTAFEDAALRKELAGYQEYAEKVKYRLVPEVW
jgi:protein-S-isoprenylcysteine O-methyltransferase Ste14